MATLQQFLNGYKNTIVFSVEAVSATATGATLIFTTASDLGVFVCTKINFIPRVITGIVIDNPIGSFGTLSSSYTDLRNTSSFADGLIIALTPNMVIDQPLNIPIYEVEPSTGVFVNVATAVTGATVFIFDVQLQGYYIVT